MPLKRKSRGTPVSREARTTRSSAKKAKTDHSESEVSATSDDEKSSNKGRRMNVMRYNFDDLLTRYHAIAGVGATDRLGGASLARCTTPTLHHFQQERPIYFAPYLSKGAKDGFMLFIIRQIPWSLVETLHSLRSRMQIQVYLSENRINLYVRVSRDVDDAIPFQITKKL